MTTPKNYGNDPSRLTKAQWYRLCITSGLLTTIAAGTASAGHLFAARYVNALGKVFFVTRLRARWDTVAGFTAAQEVGISAFKLTGYSAAHTGGNAATVLTSPGAAATSLSARIGNTAELTAGTQTIGAQLLHGAFSELAAGAGIPKGFIDEEQPGALTPVEWLANNEGILIRNDVLMGAGGTGRLTVELTGYERAP